MLALRTTVTLLCGASAWIVNPNVKASQILKRMMHSIFVALPKISGPQRMTILNAILCTTLDWANLIDSSDPPLDPAQLQARIQAVLEAFQESTGMLSAEETTAFLERGIEFLEGSAFDIRTLLMDAPSDFCLEPVAREHFAPTLALLMAIKGCNLVAADEVLERIRRIVENYFEILVGHLLGSVSFEPFMCALVHVLLVRLPSLPLARPLISRTFTLPPTWSRTGWTLSCRYCNRFVISSVPATLLASSNP